LETTGKALFMMNFMVFVHAEILFYATVFRMVLAGIDGLPI
jgi:hypothetical protein